MKNRREDEHCRIAIRGAGWPGLAGDRSARRFRHRQWPRHRVLACLVGAAMLAAPSVRAQSSDEVAELKRELAAKQAQLERQREELARQQAELERQAAELAALAARLEKAVGGPGAESSEAAVQAQAPPQPQPEPDLRDAVGDLNAGAVAAGEFPGSILIPGTRQVSLEVGGFVKTVAIADSDLEGAGPIFLPALIGAGRPDTEGNTSFDASLSRVFLDGRAPTPNGSVRGYIEVDLNGANNGSLGIQLRHAYGSWRRGRGTLTAGHTWSTAMDLGVLPEGLTEPTVSGAIFQRQAQLRWSQGISEHFRFDVALEDGTSSDTTISGPWRASTRLPDLIAATGWDWGSAGHLRLTGLLREIRATDESGRSASATAWGVSLGSHIGVGKTDKLAFGVSTGDGGGRYLLGVPPGAAGFLDVDGEIVLQRAAGAFATYRHVWTPKLRSTVAFGEAWVEDASWQAPDAFDSSTLGLVNLMWSPLHYVTFGAEFQYGKRETKDGGSRDNQRVIFGVQIF